jgi:hypothetical protein
VTEARRHVAGTEGVKPLDQMDAHTKLRSANRETARRSRFRGPPSVTGVSPTARTSHLSQHQGMIALGGLRCYARSLG